MDVFVTGTDTDVGKTVLSALLATALPAGYWKPIQTGRLGGRASTDRETVLRWADLDPRDAPPETYLFDPPVSPHLAASQANVVIDLTAIRRPRFDRRLIIEGAGGALVPINETAFMIDLMAHLDVPVVVAARTALGTINHTLLTVDAIQRRGLSLIGVTLIGEENPDNRNAIERYGGVPVIGWIPPMRHIDKQGLLQIFDRHFDHSRIGKEAILES